MYFYKIAEYEILGDMRQEWDQIIHHEEKFSQIEFEVMCNQAMNELKKRDFILSIKNLSEELRDMFGFQVIKPVSQYDFEI